MRNFLPLLGLLTFSLSACGQRYKEYNFPDIGMHITISDNYVIQSTFPKQTFLEEDGKEITDTTKLKQLEADLMKGLLVVSSLDGNNVISFNIATETAKTGNFEVYYNFTKDMQQLMAKQQMTNYDTASSVLTSDNIKVHRFMTYSVKTKPIHYSEIYLANVRNYFLVIKADYIDTKFGEEMENAISASKFN